MSYIVQKKNRILRIPEEKMEEYAKMGYEVRDEAGNIISEAAITSMAEAQKIIATVKTENEELKAKLKEATLYAENADKKIAELQKENENLKAMLKEQTTAGEAATETADSGKKTTSKATKKAE